MLKDTSAAEIPSEFRELKSKSQPRWHLIYYLLAAFDLVVILFSLFLNNQLIGIYNRSVQINQQWAERLGHYTELSQLASQVNAPGNDVFDSRNIASESRRLEASIESFYESLASARADLSRNVPKEESIVLSDYLDEIAHSIEGIKEEAGLIFSHFEKGETERAGERMATMDRHHARVIAVLANLNRHVRGIQSARLDEQSKDAQALARFEYAIFTAVVLIIGAVILYGRKLLKQIRSREQEINEYLTALHTSEESFRAVTEYSPIGIFQTDPRGRFFYSNKRLQELSGYPLEEGVGDGWKRAIHPDDLQGLTEELKTSFAEGRHFSHQYRLVTPAGEVRWVYSRCIPLTKESGEVIRYVGTTEDITEQKLAEQRLKLKNAVTTALAEAASQQEAITGILHSVCENTEWEIGRVWSLDAQRQTLSCIAMKHTATSDFADFEAVSRRMTFAHGDGLPGRVWASRKSVWMADLSGDDNFSRALHALKCGLRSAFAFPIILHGEVIGVMEFLGSEVRQPDDAMFDLLNSISSQIGQFLDRKRAEEALRESEEHVRLILDTALDAVVSIDSSGTVTKWNTQAEKMFGWNRSEAIGQKLSELIIPLHHREAHEQGMNRYMATGEARVMNRRIEITALRRNKEEFPVELAIAPVWSNDNVRFSAFIRDITERRLAEGALRASEERFSKAFHLSPQCLIIATIEEGIYIDVNETFLNVTGYSRDEVIGRSSLELGIWDASTREHFLKILEERGSISNLEVEYRRKSGDKGVLLVSSEPIDIHGTPCLLTVAADITDRKRVEETLRESEERFRSAIDHAPIGMALVALNGHFIQVNRALCEIVGYSESELLFTDFQSITHPDDLEADLENVRRMIEGQISTYQIEKRYIHKSRRVVWILLSCSLVHDRTGKPLYFIAQIQDINERKEAEEKLRLNEALLRTVIDSSPDWIFIKDRNHRYILANRSYARSLGLEPAGFAGKNDIALGFPVDIVMGNKHKGIRGFWADDREVIDSGETKFIEEEFAVVDGKEMILSTVKVPLKDASGWVWGVLGFMHDITDRKQAEERLRRSEEKFRALLESASEAILTTNRSGHITLINAKAEQTFGYDREELIGQHVEMLMPERYRRQHSRFRRDFFSNPYLRPMGSSRELVGRQKSGEEFPIEISLSYVKTGEDMIAMAFISDITERKRVEVQLREAKESAESANRAKSEFLANMSHEIRTPMNAVIGMTGLLLDTELTGEQQEFVEVIRASSDSLLTIINDILDFSKIESGKLELEHHPFDLRDSIEEALDLLATKAAEKNLNLAYTIDSETPAALVGDSTRLRQILVNLVNNAVKFTEAGEVVVSISARPLPEDEDRGVSYPGGETSHSSSSLYELHFAVKDTGIGIPTDRMDRLFQSFSQVDASTTRLFGGTGLGLAISKRLAEMMGGTMWVESEAGRGSKFHFTITAIAAPSQTRVFLKSIQPQLKGRRMLIVDDNSTNRRILELQADCWGMKPCVASSGQQALEWILRGDPFDVAILDMQMPEMDGARLATEIRRRRDETELPMVMLTSVGKRGKEDLEGCFSAFLTKPIKPAQLYDALIGVFEGGLSKVIKPTVSRRGFRAIGQQNPLKILLVEDNVVNQKVAIKILERMGYRADVAGNGLEAIQALERQRYDLILMDVQMPEMDGLAATREICRRWSRAERPRIIAMTANAMQGDREECLASGMDDYISKPLQTEEMMAALERNAEEIATDDFLNSKVEEPIDFSLIESVFGTDSQEDREAISQLVQVYIEDAGRQLLELEDALRVGDAQSARLFAHALKGGSATLGAKALSELCGEMEKIGQEGSLAGAWEVLERMKVEFERVRKALAVRELLKSQ